ncbi:hypothetical protein AAC387_Pa05g2876 [Persea americana]
MSSTSAAINIPESSTDAKAVPEPSTDAKAVAAVSTPIIATSATKRLGGWRRGIAILDFLLRLCAIVAALAATITMGTTDQTLPFFTQFFQFEASYDDLPTFTFFVIGNAIVSGYLVLSLPFSIVTIVRPHAVGIRFLLVLFDTAMLALSTAASSAAAAIVYLAHNGNSSANWIAICQQFNDFCQRISGVVVASFIAAAIFIVIVIMSAFALRRP